MLQSPLTILFEVTLGVFTSCTHDPIDPVDPPLAGACDLDTVYFQNNVLPVLVANCASSGCHSDNNLMDAINRVNYSPMPPAMSLSECEINQFKIWVNDGMPNN
jgi:hypothetical protein